MEEEVKYCRKCGTKLENNSSFCTNCGTPTFGPLVDNTQLPPQQVDDSSSKATGAAVAVGVLGSVVGIVLLAILSVIVFMVLVFGACILLLGGMSG